MRINMTAKGMTVTEAMWDKIEKKLGKLEKYFKNEPDVQVKLSQEKGARNIAEITLTVNGTILRAQESTSDMYASIENAVDKLDKQIRRHRSKLDKAAIAEALTVEDIPAYEDEPDELVKVKRFAVKPMSVEDAIAEMDMLGHSFYVFVNAETNITSVIYRRADGKIGMLEPIIG